MPKYTLPFNHSTSVCECAIYQDLGLQPTQDAMGSYGLAWLSRYSSGARTQWVSINQRKLNDYSTRRRASSGAKRSLIISPVHQPRQAGRPQGHSWSCDEMSIRICSCWSVKICYPLLFIWALETLQLIIPHKQNHFNRNEREAPQSLLTRWDLVVGQTTNWWIRKRHNSIRILLATRDTHTRGYPRWQVPVAGSKRRSVSSV